MVSLVSMVSIVYEGGDLVERGPVGDQLRPHLLALGQLLRQGRQGVVQGRNLVSDDNDYYDDDDDSDGNDDPDLSGQLAVGLVCALLQVGSGHSLVQPGLRQLGTWSVSAVGQCAPSPTFMGLPCSLMAVLMVLMLWSRLSISILVSSTVSSALRLAASVSAIRSSNALK